MAEYILLDKPALYLVNNEKNMSSMLTDFGVEAFSACSHAYSELDISSFIKSVIENKNSYAEKREKFIDRNGLQQFGSPSENIVNEIKYRLFNSYSGE
jgi:dissimilatory sulfite reductase (desulfoviridin) alpha/beta subunit